MITWEGLDFFNKEEFFNVYFKQYGNFDPPNKTVQDLQRLPNYTVNDIDSEIKTKPY